MDVEKLRTRLDKDIANSMARKIIKRGLVDLKNKRQDKYIARQDLFGPIIDALKGADDVAELQKELENARAWNEEYEGQIEEWEQWGEEAEERKEMLKSKIDEMALHADNVAQNYASLYDYTQQANQANQANQAKHIEETMKKISEMREKLDFKEGYVDPADYKKSISAMMGHATRRGDAESRALLRAFKEEITKEEELEFYDAEQDKLSDEPSVVSCDLNSIQKMLDKVESLRLPSRMKIRHKSPRRKPRRLFSQESD